MLMSKERESETALPERWSAKAKSDEGETSCAGAEAELIGPGGGR